jgi:Galactocerebrosidase, C-terminal lectin domain
MPAARLALLVATVLAVVGLSGAVPAQDERRVINLFKTTSSGLPEGFVAARTGRGPPSEWMALNDPAAGRVLEQISADRADGRYPLAICQDLSAANVDVTVRFKPMGGEVARAGGIAVRLADPDNYYVVGANALEDNVRLYRVVKGARSQIEGVSAKVDAGLWHTLELRAEGDRFAVSYDGKPLFTATDETFSGPGKIALWTKADSQTRFDALTIAVLP